MHDDQTNKVKGIRGRGSNGDRRQCAEGKGKIRDRQCNDRSGDGKIWKPNKEKEILNMEVMVEEMMQGWWLRWYRIRAHTRYPGTEPGGKDISSGSCVPALSPSSRRALCGLTSEEAANVHAVMVGIYHGVHVPPGICFFAY